MRRAFDDAKLADLRGTLRSSRNSARDLSTTAQTRCVRRRALAVVGVDADAAAALIGAKPTFGQSPFAIGAGDRFEEGLVRDGYARWLEGLHTQLGLPANATEVVDLDRAFPWPDPEDRAALSRTAADRRAKTDTILVDWLTRRRGPLLVLHPRLRLTITDTVRDVEPDALVTWPGLGRPRIAEVKSYVDHGHRTDASDLAKTRQQIAVYLLALDETVQRLHREGKLPDRDAGQAALRGPWPNETGIAAHRIAAITVLRRAQSMAPSMGIECVERDVELVRRGLRRTPATLGEMLSALPAGVRLDNPDVLLALPASYEPAWCLGNCPLAQRCRSDAREAAHPSVFGGETPSVLAPVPDLGRVHALATDSDMQPAPGESALTERLRLLQTRIERARRAC